MNKIHSGTLIETLSADVRAGIRYATALKQYGNDVLQFKPAADAWSIAQILAHLNVYGKFYITEAERQLHLHYTQPVLYYKPGVLGSYFVKTMAPVTGNTKSRKMKTVKVAEPEPNPDALATIEQFIFYQHQLLNLLQLAAGADMGKVKVPTFLSRFISLKLGDMLRFVVAHQQRHFAQAGNILKSTGIDERAMP